MHPRYSPHSMQVPQSPQAAMPQSPSSSGVMWRQPQQPNYHTQPSTHPAPQRMQHGYMHSGLPPGHQSGGNSGYSAQFASGQPTSHSQQYMTPQQGTVPPEFMQQQQHAHMHYQQQQQSQSQVCYSVCFESVIKISSYKNSYQVLHLLTVDACWICAPRSKVSWSTSTASKNAANDESVTPYGSAASYASSWYTSAGVPQSHDGK